jgi:hypothetical protein
MRMRVDLQGNNELGCLVNGLNHLDVTMHSVYSTALFPEGLGSYSRFIFLRVLAISPFSFSSSFVKPTSEKQKRKVAAAVIYRSAVFARGRGGIFLKSTAE